MQVDADQRRLLSQPQTEPTGRACRIDAKVAMITDSDRRRVAILILGLHAIRREQFKAYSVLDHPLEILLKNGGIRVEIARQGKTIALAGNKFS